VSDSDTLTRRMDALLARLRTSYDGIGHSSGRPYIYFIYPPEQDRAVRLLAADTLRDDAGLCFHHIGLLPLTITAIKNQEDQRRALLLDPRAPSAAGDILRLWTRALLRDVATALGSPATSGRPVVVLRGLAALHPLGNPTAVMEAGPVKSPGSAGVSPVPAVHAGRSAGRARRPRSQWDPPTFHRPWSWRGSPSKSRATPRPIASCPSSC